MVVEEKEYKRREGTPRLQIDCLAVGCSVALCCFHSFFIIKIFLFDMPLEIKSYIYDSGFRYVKKKQQHNFV